MTPKRQGQIERTLRKLRSHYQLFEDGPEAVQIERLIHKCKRRLRPVWDAREDERRERASERKLSQWA